jgi:hypothetical protein
VHELQSLLFCRNEKTAVVMTQLLEQVGAGVRRESDISAAIRQLTTEHFDFLVIDCENSENAKLLLKCAHNSACNKKTLAVAMVDGKAGAEGFRLGADFVLTKPIAIGQATGVLRLVQSQARRGQRMPPEATATGETLREESAIGNDVSSGVGGTTVHPNTPAENPQGDEPAALQAPAVSPLRAKAASATADYGSFSQGDESLGVAPPLKQTSSVNLHELEAKPPVAHEETRAIPKAGLGAGPKPVRGKDRFAMVSIALLGGAALAGWQLGSYHGKPEWISWLLALLKRII